MAAIATLDKPLWPGGPSQEPGEEGAAGLAEESSGEAPRARDPKITTFQMDCGGGACRGRRGVRPSPVSGCVVQRRLTPAGPSASRGAGSRLSPVSTCTRVKQYSPYGLQQRGKCGRSSLGPHVQHQALWSARFLTPVTYLCVWMKWWKLELIKCVISSPLPDFWPHPVVLRGYIR